MEAFNSHSIDAVDEVLRHYESGMTLVNRPFGVEASRLGHNFIAIADGTLYRSTPTIGTSLPGFWSLLNPLFHPRVFTEAMGHAWLRQNVEEVGALENLIPLLAPHLAGTLPS